MNHIKVYIYYIFNILIWACIYLFILKKKVIVILFFKKKKCSTYILIIDGDTWKWEVGLLFFSISLSYLPVVGESGNYLPIKARQLSTFSSSLASRFFHSRQSTFLFLSPFPANPQTPEKAKPRCHQLPARLFASPAPAASLPHGS